MSRPGIKLAKAILLIALVSSALIQLNQFSCSAQTESNINQSLLVEGEPGFKKPEIKTEDTTIEKPKLTQGVEFYFSTMANLFIAIGAVLVIISIYSAIKNKK